MVDSSLVFCYVSREIVRLAAFYGVLRAFWWVYGGIELAAFLSLGDGGFFTRSER